MTQMTPPGWYPDPGQRSDAPTTERWWDGTAWTEQTRVLGAAGAWGPPTAPAWPPAAPPSARRRAVRATIGGVVALAVLGGLVGGVYALTRNDGDGGDDDRSRASSPAPQGAPTPEPGPETESPDAPSGPRGPGVPSPGGPAQPPAEEGYVTDGASGISLPVPEGWSGESAPIGAQLSTGPYPCPGDAGEQCARAGADSAPAAAYRHTQTSAAAIARTDIEQAAERAYGGKTYGRITSHQVLANRATTVAGGEGHLVRWKVVTEKGDDGYVQSLVFPSPKDAKQFVVVRFGFDVSDKAPAPSVMDEIAKGIKKAPQGVGSGRSA
ncbi:DUF2510 domain-containing protein [Streptomyces sp. NPDC002490]|uniref:DUF2510 domain-containing protein n=1 Tax=Streptomyces sp. NPDC002490 TaxID=3154416 RepID=UPI0033271A83